MDRTAASAQQLCSTEAPQHYVWKFPGAPVHIYVQLKTIARLREYVFSGLHSDNSESIEVGGLLLGKTRPQHVEVTGFLPFALDSSSRYFVPNAPEKARFRDAINGVAETSKEGTVVGYFRSSLRGGVRLFDDDLALIKDFFPDPDNIFLVIGAEEIHPPLAGFFVWDSEEIYLDSSFMPFPLDEKLLEASTLPTARPKPAVIQPKAVAAVPKRRRSRWTLSVGAVFLAAVAAAIAFVYTQPRTGSDDTSNSVVRPSSAPSPNSGVALSLSGQLRDSGIEITWDPTIAKARVGVLAITDGESRREVPLTQTQLESRKLIYAPASSQVEVALEVFSSDGIRSRESLFFLLPTLPVRASLPIRDSQLAEPQKNPSSPAALRSFVPPTTSRPSATATQDLSVEPPTLPSAIGTSSLTNSPGLVSPAPTTASIAPPAQQIPAISKVDGEITPPAVRDPAMPITPPRPLRRAQPLLPRDLTSTLGRRLDVHIRAFVDVNGKVTKTEIVENTLQNSTDRFLATAALQAARLWTFTPAMRGAEKISDVIVLQFTFGTGKAAASKPR